MKKSIKYIIMILLILIINISFWVFIYTRIYNINNLPKGRYLSSETSPNGKYKLNAYLYSGGATEDFTLRVEVEDINATTSKNIYWKDHDKTANMYWINNETVIINGKKLNVLKDKYDFRYDFKND